MQLALDASFGSVDRWHADFLARGQGRVDGAVMLVFDPSAARLRNRASDTAEAAEASEAAEAADVVPLLVLAVPHHRKAVADIDWAEVYTRYQHAVEAASVGCGATHDDTRDAVLVDVRRAGVFAKADSLIPGAHWRDPAAVSQWAAELPADRACVVYCIYGHEVGRATALRLRAAGVDARYLSGGIDGWKAAGRPLVPKSAG